MTRIALIGYGKMGKAIEKIAQSQGHQIVARIDHRDDFELNGAEVAIEFSQPEAAYSNLNKCLSTGTPVVCGTTGWLDSYHEICQLTTQNDTGFLYASNFSIGVNLFFALNARLAQLMSSHTQYKASMSETHHIYKLDAPSGTAITLAEGIIENTPHTRWHLSTDPASAASLPIVAYREGEVPGTHEINYDSEVDSIQIRHTAHSREGFASGALAAALWLVGKKGVYSMKDVLNI